MRTIWSGALLGNGMGFFGRFVLALVLILVLKSQDRKNPRLDRGLKILIVLGIIALAAMALLFGIWMFSFARMISHPSIFSHFYY